MFRADDCSYHIGGPVSSLLISGPMPSTGRLCPRVGQYTIRVIEAFSDSREAITDHRYEHIKDAVRLRGFAPILILCSLNSRLIVFQSTARPQSGIPPFRFRGTERKTTLR